MKKRRKPFPRYSAEFKIRAILDMRKHHLSYVETACKYWHLLSSEDAYRYTGNIRRWERIYLEDGEHGLMEERRGKARDHKCGRAPKLTPDVEEDLIAENQRLRMENAYLKKLRALILAKEQAKRSKR